MYESKKKKIKPPREIHRNSTILMVNNISVRIRNKPKTNFLFLNRVLSFNNHSKFKKILRWRDNKNN